jgi:hypothetical protein
MDNFLRRHGKWISRRAGSGLAIVATALMLVPAASGSSLIYWWQRNMAPDQVGFDRFTAHNHNYNELAFGANAGWWSEVWEVTPAGYRHFDRMCQGNCYNAHPPYYFTYVYCANRDGRTHFVYDCRTEW